MGYIRYRKRRMAYTSVVLDDGHWCYGEQIVGVGR